MDNINKDKVIRHITAEIEIAKICKKDFASVDIDMLIDALSLLKEQEAVVRCKDCKYWYFADNRIPSEQENVCGRNGVVVTPDWFCADGKIR